MKRHFTNEYMRKHSMSLFITKMKTKSTVSQHCLLTRMAKIQHKGSNRCGSGLREGESLIKWNNIKRFLKNTKCPTTRQPSPRPPGISVRQTKNSKCFMGMFILV